MNVVIAGGGTAGHVNPAIALAGALSGDSVVLVGTTKGVESRLVPAAGLPLETIEVRGFDRSKPWTLPSTGLQAVRAVAQAKRIITDAGADVVVGMGGYVSLPVTMAAKRKGVPVVLHEQNIVLGLAHKVSKRFAEKVAVSFRETLTQAGKKGVYTGNPVLPALANFDRARARSAGYERFGLDPTRQTLLVFGGSLGARTVNVAALGITELWKDRSDLQVLHITGSTAEAADPGTAKDHALVYVPVPFVDAMAEAYAVADLALTRGGATTVAELCVAGLPSIIVPYPHHRDQQQTRHARVLEMAGASILLPDSETTAEKVAQLSDSVLSDPHRSRAMGEAAARLGRPDAAERLAEVVREVAT